MKKWQKLFIVPLLAGAALLGVIYALIAVAIVRHFYPTVYPIVEEKLTAVVRRVFPKKEARDV